MCWCDEYDVMREELLVMVNDEYVMVEVFVFLFVYEEKVLMMVELFEMLFGIVEKKSVLIDWFVQFECMCDMQFCVFGFLVGKKGMDQVVECDVCFVSCW